MTEITLHTAEGEQRMTLGEFLAGNPEFDSHEVAEIRDFIANGVEYHGGGGSQPQWIIRPARG